MSSYRDSIKSTNDAMKAFTLSIGERKDMAVNVRGQGSLKKLLCADTASFLIERNKEIGQRLLYILADPHGLKIQENETSSSWKLTVSGENGETLRQYCGHSYESISTVYNFKGAAITAYYINLDDWAKPGEAKNEMECDISAIVEENNLMLKAICEELNIRWNKE